MRAGRCLNLVLPDEERVALLMEDYDFFVRNTEIFCERLDALTQIRGKQIVEGWKNQVRGGQIEPVVRDLLLSHYDPVYVQSMERNFSHYAQAQSISPCDRTAQAMLDLAHELLKPSS
jgi:tRNA 2-selenouridine synthase